MDYALKAEKEAKIYDSRISARIEQCKILFQSCGNHGIKMGGHHSLPQHVDDYYNVLHD